ncbi:cysteine dioxygenase [Streptomyces spiramenti]|uniref:Cysteine dioxygenase n=1 Tax=Streptomyces spiramenti TaxID=2720606 RepID=A0ABX1AIX6_9ACTN|nr:cysteine dioxygenase family protein [Streptomyces spiramenti]NJP65616.1 cysteine dioxygenase [Streptomyces spiramenti]
MPAVQRPAAPAARIPHSPASLAALARRFAADPGSWERVVRFTAPERFYTRLSVEADHEVWLLTWLPGQGTEIHDHGGSSGAFTVVRGELTEGTFLPGAVTPQRVEPRRLPVGGLRSFGPRYVHEVVNRGTEPAASIHAYAPALTAMSTYRRRADGILVLDRTEEVDR